MTTVKHLPKRRVTTEERANMEEILSDVAQRIGSGEVFGFIVCAVGPPGGNTNTWQYMGRGASKMALTHAMTMAMRDHVEMCVADCEGEETP